VVYITLPGRELLEAPVSICTILTMNHFPNHIDLAVVKHGTESSLLGAGNSQLPVALNLDPALGVGAVEAGQRRLPRIRGLVALCLVDIVGNLVKMLACCLFLGRATLD
jgi:hypothetical protein